MAQATTSETKTPWHLWVVGGLSLVWNSMGALDFTMTQMKTEFVMKSFTHEQLAYFTGFPLWVVLAWAVGTWGSFLGSFLLLLRNKLAVPVNLAVLVGMALTFTHNYVLTDGVRIMTKDGHGPLGFTAVIVVVGVLLFLYARAMRKRGVLR